MPWLFGVAEPLETPGPWTYSLRPAGRINERPVLLLLCHGLMQNDMSISHLIRQALGRPGLLLAVAILAPLLVACSSDDTPEYVERPVEQLYNTAMNTLRKGEYKEAAQLFDEVERQHPYSVWASLDRFIQLHPGNRDVSYAYYLKALSYYEQISDIGRDQKMTTSALQALEELQRRFPQSKYARDAALKADLARDHLAGKNMSIGRFYQSQSQHLAAINRFRTVVEHYQTTSHITEALHRLVECYLALGITDEARATAAVLGYNSPEAQKDSWIARVWKTTN
jgi:outer membrane protein assembly factor BamD